MNVRTEILSLFPARLPIGIAVATVLLLAAVACTTSSTANTGDTSAVDSQIDDLGGADATLLDTSVSFDLQGDAPSDVGVEDALVDTDPGDSSDSEADMLPDDGAPDLFDSQIPSCSGADCPIVIGTFPYTDKRDTTQSSRTLFDTYNCASDTNESGAEYVYVFETHEPGTIIASVEDGTGVDIDIHLLSKLDAQSCLARHDRALSANLDAGVYYLVADTFVSGGTPQPGAYTLRVFFIPDTSKCGMKRDSLARIGTSDLLSMPATGPVVLEAHLLTKEEEIANDESGKTFFPSGWPTSFTDRIAEHYTLSTQLSGYTMNRNEPWAPCCEPTNNYGQGSTTAKPPMVAETWYINMRWKSAPKAGTRYIAFNPFNGKAVVTAAGYENGPGDTSRVGGAS
ncbi:MAG: hypothetical protein KC609_10440, partial [Myxococcales bacterium]|nr:hypothetical protein [Myxococcales bacterium]